MHSYYLTWEACSRKCSYLMLNGVNFSKCVIQIEQVPKCHSLFSFFLDIVHLPRGSEEVTKFQKLSYYLNTKRNTNLLKISADNIRYYQHKVMFDFGMRDKTVFNVPLITCDIIWKYVTYVKTDQTIG